MKVVLAILVAILPGCASARQHTAAGVTTFLNCEAPHVDEALLADAKILAVSAVSKWISGSGTIDTAGVKADAAPLRTDLLRCAFDAAIAALVAPIPPIAGAPAASPQAINAVQIVSAWSRVRRELAWPPEAP